MQQGMQQGMRRRAGTQAGRGWTLRRAGADTARMTTPNPRETQTAHALGEAAGTTASGGGLRAALGAIGPFVVGLLLAAFVLCGWTGEAQVNQVFGLGRVAVRDGALAAAWWIGAWGLGLGLTRLVMGPTIGAILGASHGLKPGTAHGAARDAARGLGAGSPGAADRTGLDELAIALGLCSALMLVIDAVLGTLGLLGAAGGLVAWAPIGVGVVLAVRLLRDAPPSWGGALAPADGDRAAGGDPIARALRGVGLGAATALLLVAASVAPGWLWSSEFGGYDALSYHLELPKEWFLLGRAVGPTEGNVYSALPSFVESAFLQLMVMRGNPIDGAYACQWWSVGATLATAFVIARLARGVFGEGVPAALVFLATPWTTVVGTMAYNDMYPCLALATGWLLAGPVPSEERRLDARTAAALALLAAAAFGAKPSSILFTALPLAAVAWSVGGRHGGIRNFRHAPLVIGVGLVLLSPWLVRNQLAYGSPTFPFLSGVFGAGPWSAEQLQVFLGAHGRPEASLLPSLSSLALVWQQWIGYGFGAAPAPNEPWFPLWGLLPLLGIAGILATAKAPAAEGRRWWALIALVMLVLMVGGWLTATHIKSRFLLPSAVPLALGAAALLRLVAVHWGARWAAGLAVAALLLPAFAFAREPVRGTLQLGAPALLVDGMGQRTGEMLAKALPELPPEQREAALKQADSAFVINYLLPADARLLAVGFSTPFYILRPLSWSTVWDRGAFDRVIDAAPGTPAAWGPRLRAEGFTHVVIDPVMLEVWMRSGWLNPAMASGPMLDQFVQANTVFGRTIDGKLIVALKGS